MAYMTVTYNNELEVETIEELETNTMVNAIQILFLGSTRRLPVISDVFYDILLNQIRTRSQLRKLDLINFNALVDMDMDPFLEAASENIALQSLNLVGLGILTAESLGRLCSHPNLRELSLQVTSDSSDPELEIMNTFKQIIETCPMMQRVKVKGTSFTQISWQPICEGLYKVQPSMSLDLVSFLTFDQGATALLQSFLHECPHPVHLPLTAGGINLCPHDKCTWLSQLIGPAVHTLKLKFSRYILDLQDFMKSLNDRQHLRKLEFREMNSKETLNHVVNAIPDMLYVQELVIDCDPEIWYYEYDDDTLSRNTKLLSLLAKNTSITNVDFRFTDMGFSIWTEQEQQRLQHLMLRNSSCSKTFTSSDVIPLSVWPHLLRMVQTTNAGKSLTFQGLCGLAAKLSSTSESHK
jgi:hypothetical protein